MTAIAILVTPLLVLGGTAIAVMTNAGRAGIPNPARWFRKCCTPSFGGQQQRQRLRWTPPYALYNVMLAIAMWFGLGVIVPVLAMAGGRWRRRKRLAATSGTLPTTGRCS